MQVTMQSQLHFDLHPANTKAAANEPVNLSEAGITEIAMSANGIDDHTVVLPMLAHLSHVDCGRWLTWITDQKPNKHALSQFGFDTSKLRIIHVAKNTDTRWMMWEGLSNAKSHTVVTTLNSLTQEDYKHLEEAAKESSTRGIIIKQRVH